jgi:hypothetical protein
MTGGAPVFKPADAADATRLETWGSDFQTACVATTAPLIMAQGRTKKIRRTARSPFAVILKTPKVKAQLMPSQIAHVEIAFANSLFISFERWAGQGNNDSSGRRFARVLNRAPLRALGQDQPPANCRPGSGRPSPDHWTPGPRLHEFHGSRPGGAGQRRRQRLYSVIGADFTDLWAECEENDKNDPGQEKEEVKQPEPHRVLPPFPFKFWIQGVGDTLQSDHHQLKDAEGIHAGQGGEQSRDGAVMPAANAESNRSTGGDSAD